MEENKDIKRKIAQGRFIDEFGVLNYTVDETNAERPFYLLHHDVVNPPITIDDSVKYSDEDKKLLVRIAINDKKNLLKSFIEQYGKHCIMVYNVPFDSNITEALNEVDLTPIEGKPAYLAEQVNYVNF